MTDCCFELTLELQCYRWRLPVGQWCVQAQPGHTLLAGEGAGELALRPEATTEAAMEAQLQKARRVAERAQRSQRTAEARRYACEPCFLRAQFSCDSGKMKF